MKYSRYQVQNSMMLKNSEIKIAFHMNFFNVNLNIFIICQRKSEKIENLFTHICFMSLALLNSSWSYNKITKNLTEAIIFWWFWQLVRPVLQRQGFAWHSLTLIFLNYFEKFCDTNFCEWLILKNFESDFCRFWQNGVLSNGV